MLDLPVLGAAIFKLIVSAIYSCRSKFFTNTSLLSTTKIPNLVTQRTSATNLALRGNASLNSILERLQLVKPIAVAEGSGPEKVCILRLKFILTVTLWGRQENSSGLYFTEKIRPLRESSRRNHTSCHTINSVLSDGYEIARYS